MLKKIDYSLLVVTSIIIILGILILAGVSADFSLNRFGSSTYYFFHQMIWGLGIGLILAFIAFKIPLLLFKKWAWFLVLINLILMVLVFIPGLAVVARGAPRWINFGLFTFQPSELLKLTFILYLSALLACSHTKRGQGAEGAKTDKVRPRSGVRAQRTKKKDKKNWKTTLLPFSIVLTLIFTLLYFQSDASTLALIIVIGALMYFFSNTPLWHSLLIFLAGLGGTIFLIAFEPYRVNRILVFLGLLKDPMRMGYQIKQALITVGSGGIFGLGLGMSNQKIGGLLPQTMSDSIFAIFAEELGFVGCLVLILLFLVFLWRGFKIAKESRDKFSRLFATGVSCWICLQAFVNIGAIIGILPLTGIPLPFISYGGSHLIAELIGVGILLNISKSLKK